MGNKAELGPDLETDSILKWVGIGMILLIVAALLGITLHRGGDEGEAEGVDSDATAVAVVGQEKEAVKALVRDYLATETKTERLEFVRRREVVGPLMDQYYAEIEPFPLKALWESDPQPRSIEGYTFWTVTVTTPEGDENLLVEQLDDSFKVDWETQVGWNPMPPREYLRERPAGDLDFRVKASPDDYYNGRFADQGKWLVVKLRFLQSSEVIFGYIERTSPDYHDLFRLVDQGDKDAPVPLILTLEWPGGELAEGQLPQVQIKKLVSGHWLILE